MNTVKFAPFDDFTTEQHNLETASIETRLCEGREMQIYNPCNLDIWTDSKYENRYVSSVLDFVTRNPGLIYEFSLSHVDKNTDPKQLLMLLRALKDRGLHERTIMLYDNVLLDRVDGKPFAIHLAELGFTNNISYAKQWIENDEIEHLKDTAAIADINDLAFRQSVDITKEDFGNHATKMFSCLLRAQKCGINTVLFREILNDSAVFPFMLDTIEKNDSFKQIGQMHNDFYDVGIYFYETMGVKYLVKTYRAKTNPISRNTVSRFVAYSDGEIWNGYRDSAKRIFPKQSY